MQAVVCWWAFVYEYCGFEALVDGIGTRGENRGGVCQLKQVCDGCAEGEVDKNQEDQTTEHTCMQRNLRVSQKEYVICRSHAKAEWAFVLSIN